MNSLDRSMSPLDRESYIRKEIQEKELSSNPPIPQFPNPHNLIQLQLLPQEYFQIAVQA